MFTPQRKGWSLTPRTAEKNGPLPWKGKAVAAGDDLPPPRDSLGENGGAGGGGRAREAEVWRSFGEAGMLDDATFERKDREALLQRVARLEGELYDYQYNMGLLLIEKKQWTSKYDEFQQGLIDAQEILKREQIAHLAAMSEIEKREENLRRALGIEKQCVADLEKALKELHAENAEMKFTSEQKSADVSAMMAGIEEKSLEAEAKQRAADARLSELTRKSSETERKLQDLVAQESMLQRERASFTIDKELHAKEFSRQRDELLTWEKSLRERQEKLVESQNLLNQREKRSNESDAVVAKKEKELDATRERIEKTLTSLKEKEDYIHLRLTALADKEKEADRTKECLERKENELVALEEKLTAREQMEMHKIIEGHKSVLDAKKREFEMDLETKRRSFDEEHQTKLLSVEKREREIGRREEALLKKEHTLELKTAKLKDERKDLDIRSKSLKTEESNLRTKELDLEKKTKRLADDEDEFSISKAKLEIEWKSLKAEKAHVLKEMESLKVTEQERRQHDDMQSKLQIEIEECRMLKDLIIKEREELRHDREKFEREWEALDEKRAFLSYEANQVSEEKKKLDKWKCSEDERLANELLEARNNISRELAELKLSKEAFQGKMKLEMTEIQEKLQQEREDMAREYENKQHQLQIDMQKRLEDSEQIFKLEVAEFNRMREAELFRINSLRESASLEMQKMKGEHDIFEREKQEYINQRKKIEEAQLEIRNDIDSLRSLSKNLKNQREEFVREREHFLTLVDKYKLCQNCGVTITELSFPFLSSCEFEDPERALLPSLASDFLEDGFNSGMVDASPTGNVTQSGASGGRLSWLRTCTQKIFSFSPGKKNEEPSARESDGPASLDCRLNRVESVEVSRDLFDNQRTQSDDQVESDALAKNGVVPYSSAGVEENSLDVRREALDNGIGNKDNECIIPPADAQNEPTIPAADVQSKLSISPAGIQKEGTNLRVTAKETSGAEPKKKGKGVAKGKNLKRTRSVQAVVEESKSILNKDRHEENKGSHSQNERQEDVSHADRTISALGHKRRFPQTSGSAATDPNADNSGGESESISLGGRRKRRQTAAPPAQVSGDRRYNLRRSTVTGGQTKGPKNKVPSRSAAEPSLAAGGDIKGIIQSEQLSASINAEDNRDGADGNVSLLVQEVVTRRSIVEVNEFSLEKVDEIIEEEEEVDGAEATNISVTVDDGYVTEDVDSEEDSDGERLSASIGKKIWKFFTS